MDLLQIFLIRHTPIYEYYLKFFYEDLSDAQLRTRPHSTVNTLIWCLWHVARAEDIGLNRLVSDSVQVADAGGWLERMNLTIRHFGIGMVAEEVSELSQRIDLQALSGYHRAVGVRTAEILAGLADTFLNDVLDVNYLTQVLQVEGAVRDQEASQVIEAYQGMTKGWILMHLGLTHTFQHIGEATTIASLMGIHRV